MVLLRTLNVIFSLNIFERYIFKKSIEKNCEIKWKNNSKGFNKFFDSEKGYILNLTSTCLRVTFFDNASEKVIKKIESGIFNIVKSKFNINDFLIEKITDNQLEIIEV